MSFKLSSAPRLVTNSESTTPPGWVKAEPQWITALPRDARRAQHEYVTFYDNSGQQARLPYAPDLPNRGDWQYIPGSEIIRFVFHPKGSLRVSKTTPNATSCIIGGKAITAALGRRIAGKYPFRRDGDAVYIDLSSPVK